MFPTSLRSLVVSCFFHVNVTEFNVVSTLIWLLRSLSFFLYFFPLLNTSYSKFTSFPPSFDVFNFFPLFMFMSFFLVYCHLYEFMAIYFSFIIFSFWVMVHITKIYQKIIDVSFCYLLFAFSYFSHYLPLKLLHHLWSFFMINFYDV